MHWIRIRGAPESKSEERTLEEGWRATEKLPQRLGVVDGGHVACGSTGRFATIFATMLGRFWRSCGGIDSSCVTPAADCGVGVHCLAGSHSPSSVISRAVGKGHRSSTDPTVQAVRGCNRAWCPLPGVSRKVRQVSACALVIVPTRKVPDDVRHSRKFLMHSGRYLSCETLELTLHKQRPAGPSVIPRVMDTTPGCTHARPALSDQ